MASRIMHYAIAELVSREIELFDFNRFAFGSLAPDISNHEDGSYGLAHFGGDCAEKGTRGIDWIRFYDKYRDRILKDEFILGYLVHLISDACWLKHIQAKYIRIYSNEQRKLMIIKAHNDLKKCNGVLIHRYNLENKLKKIDDFDIEEISSLYINNMYLDFHSDFEYEINEDTVFEVYNYKDILSFIEIAVETSIIEIEAVRTHGRLGDPKDFYVK